MSPVAARAPARGAPGSLAVSPWWVDLVHPLPLCAAALLFLNDHVLKGAGLLPGWLTGKLSDVTGLFVFPLLVIACIRWAAAALGRPLRRDPRLSWTVAGLTGVLFAAIKLVPSVNHAVSALTGPNVMDPSDVAALGALVPAALWMMRPVDPPGGQRTRPPVEPSPGPPRSVRTAAVAFAALACAATSKKSPEPPPRAPQRGPVAVTPRSAPCARIAGVTCRYDATRFVVRLSATRHESRSCRVRVAGVRTEPVESSANGTLVEAPLFELEEGDAALIGAFGLLARPDQTWETARVWVSHEGSDAGGPKSTQTETLIPCRPGFGADTQPPTVVAQ